MTPNFADMTIWTGDNLDTLTCKEQPGHLYAVVSAASFFSP